MAGLEFYERLHGMCEACVSGRMAPIVFRSRVIGLLASTNADGLMKHLAQNMLDMVTTLKARGDVG